MRIGAMHLLDGAVEERKQWSATRIQALMRTYHRKCDFLQIRVGMRLLQAAVKEAIQSLALTSTSTSTHSEMRPQTVPAKQGVRPKKTTLAEKAPRLVELYVLIRGGLLSFQESLTPARLARLPPTEQHGSSGLYFSAFEIASHSASQACAPCL